MSWNSFRTKRKYFVCIIYLSYNYQLIFVSSLFCSLKECLLHFNIFMPINYVFYNLTKNKNRIFVL